MTNFKLNELSTSKGKILFVGDLHLHSKELSSTKKMIKNNIVILEQIYNYLAENTDIYLVIFLGDIQHLTPSGKNSTREVYRWNKMFEKIGNLMKPRFKENNIKIIDHQTTLTLNNIDYNVNKYGLEIPKVDDYYQSIENEEILPLFTLRGNHDIDSERVNGLQTTDNYSLYPYTYYDICIATGILTNPSQIIINDEVLINFYNYGEVHTVYDNHENLDIKLTIGLYHDTLITDDLPIFLQNSNSYTISEAVKTEDIAIVGHIHNKGDVQICETDTGHLVAVIVVGSMGRTSTNEGQIRDVGYCFKVDLENISQYEEVSMNLIPANEYFNLREALKRKEAHRETLNFSLSIQNQSENGEAISYQVDAETLINRAEIEQDVKEKCLDLIRKVTNKEI